METREELHKNIKTDAGSKADSYLSVSDLAYAYEAGVPVLQGLSFSADAGESIGLVGANGAGKSTFLRLLVGLLIPQGGSISVGGTVLSSNLSAKGRERTKLLSDLRAKTGYVFQDADSQLFMTTVREDVAFAPQNYGFSKEETERRTQEALARCGITHLADRSVMRLSGGEKKLAQFATILSMEPSLLLLDEPSSGLDPKNRRNLISVINSLPALKIIASHDLDFIWDTCTRVILMDGGQIIADGPAAGILTDEELLAAHGLELPLSLQRRAL